jgi:large subunit ribosomal protein L30
LTKQIKITWKKSFIGYPSTQRATIKSLGFKKLNQTLIKEESDQLRGQINKVQHLLSVEEI